MEEYVILLNGIAGELMDDDAVAGVSRELFAASNLSYSSLATRSGVSRSMAWDVLHGKKRPSVVVWARLVRTITDDLLSD